MGISSAEINRRSWNNATQAHNSHKGDQAAFLKGGGSTLFPEEVGLLGDLTGKSLVHIQCNSGQDTLSIQRLGAEVTGVDISDEAVGFAQRLSAESGIPGRFLRAEVVEWMATTDERFDVVFASYGALCWIQDLDAWNRGAHRILRPGGRLVVIEFHPMLAALDESGRGFKYPFSTHGEPHIWDDGVDDYVARSEGGLRMDSSVQGVEDFKNPNACHEFIWSEAEILGAVARSGLHLEDIRDYPYSNGCKFFENHVRLPGNRWAFPEGTPEHPQMLSFTARRLS